MHGGGHCEDPRAEGADAAADPRGAHADAHGGAASEGADCGRAGLHRTEDRRQAEGLQRPQLHPGLRPEQAEV